MPLWLERFFIEYPWAAWSPIVACVAGAGVLWWRQSRKGAAGAPGKSKPVRVGWFGAVVTVVVLIGAIAVAGYLLGLWSDVWMFVNEQPTLVAWWIAAVGAAVIVWGVAVHAWRAESRMARQCRKCRYDMTALPGVMTCPECGRVAKSEKQWRPLNVRRPALWAGGLLLLVALATPTGLAIAKRGPAGGLPTRTLVWWVSRTSEPPESVMRETLGRMKTSEPGIYEAISRHADDLAERLLECPLSGVDDYAALLTGRPISDVLQEKAVLAMGSADPVRRLAAVQLLLAAENPIVLQDNAIRTWVTDSDPRVVRQAGFLKFSQSAAAVQRLTTGVGGVAVSDTEQIRRYLRIATSTGYPVGTMRNGAIELLATHVDPEIAAYARCLIGGDQYWQIVPDPEKFVAMLRAKDDLDRLSAGQGPVWASMSFWMTSGQIDMSQLIPKVLEQADAPTREIVFRQARPSNRIPPNVSWAGSVGSWQLHLPQFEAWLLKEKDPAAREALEKLINEIKGPAPEGFLP